MLVAESNLEVEYLLTIANKAECTWLDDTCVDRTHVNFVELLALHLVEWVAVHRRIAVATVKREAQRLEPRVVVERYAVELVHLALEGVERLVYSRKRCQARSVVVGNERGDEHIALLVVEQQHIELQSVLNLGSEVVTYVVTLLGHSLLQIVVELNILYNRYIGQSYGRSGILCS